MNVGSVLMPSANCKVAFDPHCQQQAMSIHVVVVSLKQEFLNLVCGPVVDPERAFRGSQKPLEIGFV